MNKLRKSNKRKDTMHMILALIIIFLGLYTIHKFGANITSGTIQPSPIIYCVDSNTAITDKHQCCQKIQQADQCIKIDGTMDINYNQGAATGFYRADNFCILRDSKIYFNSLITIC